MDEKRKLITIGITAFNEKGFLLEAWNSVLNQTDNNWEAVMILDGGAGRETQNIFDNISHNSLRKIKLDKNRGPYFTRTLAIENTKTDWYFHLDADDCLPKHSIDKISQTVLKYPRLEYIRGKSLYFDDNLFYLRENKNFDEEKLLYTLPLTGTSPITINLFNKVGGYCKGLYNGGADWDFWIRVLSKGYSGKFLDTSMQNYEEMINLNICSLTHLTHLFLKDMVLNNKGGIINISSLASFQPIPYFSIYAATKAFVTSFTLSLFSE